MIELSEYLDYSNSADQSTGGINMIPVETPKGKFRVWTKRVGNNPDIRVLLLHGGPGATHELYECFDGYLPAAGIEYIYYDQLDSHYSDQPNDPELWTIEHFVDEVEQVRKALGLNKDNFFLFGQSWGGMLATEYALAHQQHLKGLIISNMVSDVHAYNRYAREVLGPQMDPGVFAEIQRLESDGDFENPRYEELLMQHHYTEHVLRMPLEEWPDSIMRTFKHLNKDLYVHMQGYSEFGMTPNATLGDWNRSADLTRIEVPTLTIGATHDTMDPEHMLWMAKQVRNGRYLHCPNGSHLSQYDDPDHFFPGLVEFVRDVDSGEFGTARPVLEQFGGNRSEN
ncbi:MAG: proline iminopeptidase-family hydrolase [Wenzhouxiangellaceae bacterium]